ncbi:MAG: VOC family protein [Pseudomonadota bacterium]
MPNAASSPITQSFAVGPLNAVRLFCTEVEPVADFYRDVLGLKELFRSDDAAMFQSGQVGLLIEKGDPDDAEEAELIGRFAGISFPVNDIAAVHAAWSEAGIRFHGEPERQPWGGTLAHFDDPAGNTLTLVQE